MRMMTGCRLFFFLITVSCSEQKFSQAPATGEPASSPEVAPPVSSVDSSASRQVAAGCNKDAVGITQARLLSQGISLQTSSQVIRYELSVLNCQDGTEQSLDKQPILFDLDAAFSTGWTALPFTISDEQGKELFNEKLQIVEGNDLFGRTGAYAHWTTQDLSYPVKIAKLILEIKLDQTFIQPQDPSTKSINSFLRIGNAQAIEQALQIIE